MNYFCAFLLVLSTACGQDQGVKEVDAAVDSILGAETTDTAAETSAPTEVQVDSDQDSAADTTWPAVGCTPGNDQTCNWLPEGVGLAGHCGADAKCVCKDGIGLEAVTGKCVDMSWCDPKFVDSCHGNDTTYAVTGVCQANGTCVCNVGFVLDGSGRCESATCHGGCPTQGQTRCAGGFLQTCGDAGNGCAHHWFTTDNCHLQTCNADATHCVPKATDTCTASADCPCGCGCVSGKCLCTGGIPPSCQKDADCGPECAGLICSTGKCVAAGAHP